MYQPTNQQNKSTSTKNDKDIKRMFNEHINEALRQAMTIKNDDMDVEDFKRLELFILNVNSRTSI